MKGDIGDLGFCLVLAILILCITYSCQRERDFKLKKFQHELKRTQEYAK